MGDRYERSRLSPGGELQRLRQRGLRVPAPMLQWGLPAPIGHNNGPPLEEHVYDGFVRWRWRKAHREAWKNPSLSILRFRVARAEAAGVTYERYVSELLATGRHLQKGDVEKKS